MTLPINVSKRAEREILRIDSWWTDNRTAAPDMFWTELHAAFKQIAQFPSSGSPYPLPHYPTSLRVMLPGSRYHVYYVHDATSIFVLTVWSAVRGRDPNPR